MDSLTIFILGGGGYCGTLGFGLSDNFHLGGYSGTLGFGLSDNFHWGGILGHSDLDSLTIFIGGVFWDSRIWTLTIFILGGYSGTLGFGLSDNFHWGGGYSVPSYYRIGVFCGIWTKISTTPAGSCITDSLSHTTYVETNDFIVRKKSVHFKWMLVLTELVFTSFLVKQC